MRIMITSWLIHLQLLDESNKWESEENIYGNFYEMYTYTVQDGYGIVYRRIRIWSSWSESGRGHGN